MSKDFKSTDVDGDKLEAEVLDIGCIRIRLIPEYGGGSLENYLSLVQAKKLRRWLGRRLREMEVKPTKSKPKTDEVEWWAACDTISKVGPYGDEASAWKDLETSMTVRERTGRRHVTGAYVWPERKRQ